ncbi:MAG: MFS transporter [Sphingobium sp.]|nr:MFS transporter [Sphingobium sp.]
MNDRSILTTMENRRYRAWLLTMLLLTNMFAFVDRQIISVLNQPIKIELGLTDTELGLLGGMAFAALNCVFSLPIARMSERMNRAKIYGIGIIIWSVATVSCGFATGFLVLLLARMAVGIGEAAQPAATSLTFDYYPPHQRVAASSILTLAIPLGVLIGAAGGGIIAEELGWRWAFFIVGTPGILLGILFMTTIREPLRGYYDPPPQGGEAVPPLSAVVRRALQRRSYVHVLLGSTLAGASGFGINVFLAAYFFRRFGMDFAQSGLISGLISAIPGAISMFCGGMLANRLARQDKRFFVLVPGIGLLLVGPLYLISLLQSDWVIMAILLMITGLFQYAYLPASTGVYANIMEPRMRATSGAIVVIFTSLLGSGAGPLVVGMLSDYFARQNFGADFDVLCAANIASQACNQASADALTTAMMIVALAYIWAALHFFLAARTIEQDMAD